jgi:mannose-6-phosphate isomerase-like protein (cupin superfamily)
MLRRDFLQSTGLVSAFAALPQYAAGEFQHDAMNDNLKPFLVPSLPPLEHKGAMDIRVCVRSAMTNGLFSSVECAVAPKLMGPSPHYHKELDELMYVLEGTASILMGDDVIEVGAGGWHLRPRCIKHTFWNASDAPLRFIDMYFHQPFEEYLERTFHQLTPENGYPENSEKKKKEKELLAEKFGIVHASNSREERKAIADKYGLK